MYYPFPEYRDDKALLDSLMDRIRKGLSDRDPVVRMRSAEILYFRGKSTAMPVINGLLKDTDNDIRFRTARFLVENKDRTGIPVLIVLLRTDRGESAHDTLKRTTKVPFNWPHGVMGTSDWEHFYQKWENWWQQNKSSFEFPGENVTRTGAAAVPGIAPDVQEQIVKLSAPMPEQRIEAALALGAMGEKAAPAVSQLIAMLNDAEHRRRRESWPEDEVLCRHGETGRSRRKHITSGTKGGCARGGNLQGLRRAGG